MKKFLLFALLLISSIGGITSSYYFGVKSFDNTLTNIQEIEDQKGVKFPVVSFIFDPREKQNVPEILSDIADQLGRDRIYHLTISPNQLTAQQVADGAFDAEYLQVFQKIKEKKLKVIFRTMHEMNGGRYPRSSNPETFKKARIHVRNLSRTAGLNQSDILFDFSVNHWDMPTTAAVPSQASPLIQCTPNRKGCYRFEDYYPGDAYVDMIGFTFYNRGKATSPRQRLTPEQILLSQPRNTLQRLKAFNKPLIIDEVGTTTVRYEGTYSATKSREVYLTETERKETRLSQLETFLKNNPEIILAVYFNVDYTAGLQAPMLGEADRSIVDLQNSRIYQNFFSLYQNSTHDINQLASYFLNSKVVELDGQTIIAQKSLISKLKTLNAMLEDKLSKEVTSNDPTIKQEKKAELIQRLISMGIRDSKIQQSLEILKAITQ